MYECEILQKYKNKENKRERLQSEEVKRIMYMCMCMYMCVSVYVHLSTLSKSHMILYSLKTFKYILLDNSYLFSTH